VRAVAMRRAPQGIIGRDGLLRRLRGYLLGAWRVRVGSRRQKVEQIVWLETANARASRTLRGRRAERHFKSMMGEGVALVRMVYHEPKAPPPPLPAGVTSLPGVKMVGHASQLQPRVAVSAPQPPSGRPRPGQGHNVLVTIEISLHLQALQP
jgi:hypothetical protein